MLPAPELKGGVHLGSIKSSPEIPHYLFLVTAGPCLAPTILKEQGGGGDQDEE